MNQFAQLKQELRSHKISHQKLADYVNYSREHITCLLTGRYTVSDRTALYITQKAHELIEGKSSCPKKDFNKRAKALRHELSSVIGGRNLNTTDLITQCADLLAELNPRFNKDKFINYILNHI